MSSNSPCAACKCLRRKCTQECVFAPYFPPDQPKKFEVVHKVFGASNVTKLLNELNTAQREDAVNSLAYEAEARLRDPIFGCVGHISVLQNRLKQAQSDLISAKKELAGYIGPQAMMALLPAVAPQGFIIPQQPMMAIPPMSQGGMVQQPQAMAQHHQQQQIYEAQQLAAVAREQEIEMLRTLEVQQQQQGEDEMLRFNSGGFDGGNQGNMVTATGFNQIVTEEGSIPSLGIGIFDDVSPYHDHQQPPTLDVEPLQQFQEQLLIKSGHSQGHVLEPHQQESPEELAHEQPLQQRAGSEEMEAVGSVGAPNL
ncbi:hypothetical protein ACFE04_023676 [Oxalis oulophora]